MGNDSSPTLLTGSATTALKSCFLFNVCVNKTLTGTMIIKEGTTAVANFAVGTPPGNYHQNPSGGRYGSLNITLSAGDDVTAYTKIA